MTELNIRERYIKVLQRENESLQRRIEELKEILNGYMHVDQPKVIKHPFDQPKEFPPTFPPKIELPSFHRETRLTGL